MTILKFQKRGLTRAEAAEYVGAGSVYTFDNWRREGRMPGPMAGTTRYDRVALDRAMDRLSGVKADGGDPFLEWERSYESAS